VSTSRTLPVVELAGTGRQRGEAHGESLRELVLEAIDRWKDNVLARAPVDADAYLTELVDNSGFRRAIDRHAPDLAAEVEGIAAASGTDERVVLGLNLMDEEWWLREVMRGDRRLDHCTSVAHCATDGEPTLLAQNMDLSAWMDGLQVLFDVSPLGKVESSRATPRALVPSHAGMIGLNALNEHGVGITVNALPQLPVSADGLPVAFVIRLLATAPDLATAAALVDRIQHASGQNYTIGDRDGAVSLECSSAGATRYDPGGPTIAHSNHPLASGSVSGVSDGDASQLLPHEQNSISRLQYAAAWLNEQPVSIRSLHQLLSEPPVLRGREGDDGFSFYGVVMECTDTPALWMTPGPPGTYAFEHRALASSKARVACGGSSGRRR
jgi:isopenicillin-N N-acyltransferase-like protein